MLLELLYHQCRAAWPNPSDDIGGWSVCILLADVYSELCFLSIRYSLIRQKAFLH